MTTTETMVITAHSSHSVHSDISLRYSSPYIHLPLITLSLAVQKMVVFSLYTIGRMEKHYSQPEKFQPERWIRNEERKKVNSYAYIPFSLGSRSCIGKKVAEAQMAFFISKVNYRNHSNQ